MKRLAFIPILLLLAIALTSCNLFDSNNALPVEMVAFNSLTDEEKGVIPVSPKDSNVKIVAVNGEIKSLIDNNYDEEEVYSVTFNHTETNSSENLVVFMALDKKTVVGKSFNGK